MREKTPPIIPLLLIIDSIHANNTIPLLRAETPSPGRSEPTIVLSIPQLITNKLSMNDI